MLFRSDKLVDSVYGKNKEYRKRYENLVSMNKLSAAIVITSQGIPFMLSGEEFARSKDGDENSFSSSREENMIDWKNLDNFSDIVEYYRGLLKIRESFEAFKDCTAMTANNLTYIENVPKGVTGYTINNTTSNKWSKMSVIFNGSDDEQSVKIGGEWIRIADEETAGLRNLGEVNGTVKLKAHSAAILVDKKSYETAGISDDEGAVVVNYYDNKTKELIKTQTVSGEIGTAYDVTNFADSLNYDIKQSSGDTADVFENSVKHASVYVEEFEGKMSKVIFKFVDDVNNTELADSYVIRNREDEQYFTPELPSIENYKIVLDSLPDNGAGKVSNGETVVTYKYTRVTDDTDKSVCIVNAIYMDDKGKIIEKKTYKGKEGENYSVPENEYENMSLVKIPENVSGNYKKGEINVLLNYSSTPDPFADMLIYVYVGAGVILALCIASAIYSHIKGIKKFRENMDVEE